MMKSCGVVFLMAGLILAVGANYAQAGLAVDFTSVTTNATNGNWSLGWSFTVNQSVTVTALGFYDDLQNGLTEPHDVAIYDAQQQIVVSGQVVRGDPLVSWWRWTQVQPVVLVPGVQYEIIAVTGAENYTWAPVGFVADPQVNYLADAYHTPLGGGVLAYPNRSDGVVGDFGPNFLLTSAIPAPGGAAIIGAGPHDACWSQEKALLTDRQRCVIQGRVA